MSGLQLQVLSNPGLGDGPSFVIGNPQAVSKPRKKRSLAKNPRKRENSSMSKRRKRRASHRRKATHRRKAHRRHRRNPFETVLQKGSGPKLSSGHYHTDQELKKSTRTVKFKIDQLRKYRGKPSNIAPALVQKRIKQLESEIRDMVKLRSKGRQISRAAKKDIHRLKAAGYKVISAARVTARKAASGGSSAPARSGKRSYGIIGREGNTLLIRKKDGTVKRVAMKGRRKVKVHAAPGGKRRKSGGKRRKSGAKRRKSSRKGGRAKFVKSNRAGYSCLQLANGKKKYFKLKGRKKRGKARRKSAKRKNPRRRRHYAMNPRRRRRARHGHRKHGKRRGSRRHYRKNPFGGTMGKALDFVTAGDPKEAGYILAAAALSEVIASAALQIPGLGSLLTTVNTALAGINANLAAAVTPILPTFFAALGAEFAGQKTGNKMVQDFGKALMITNIVDLGEALGASLSSATGLAGVSFTPMGRRHRHMGAVPRGLSAVPRGLSAVPRGMRGLTMRDNADFGTYLPSPGGTLSTDADFGRQMADFGGVSFVPNHMSGVDFTMGAVPSMRGAHTGDVMYQAGAVDADGNQDNSDESNDHTV